MFTAGELRKEPLSPGPQRIQVERPVAGKRPGRGDCGDEPSAKRRIDQGVTNAVCRTRNIAIVPLVLEAILTSQRSKSGI